MSELSTDRDPVEVLASEFTDRLRQGEHPTVEEYVARYPDCAEQIRDLFPMIAAMEQWKAQRESHSGGRASLGPTRLERLGDFRILREIGRGGMGIVYEAEQESLARRVAVKVLPRQALLEERHLLRFRREAKTAARLHHTNIVPVLGIGEQDGFHFIVMQYIRGVGLDEIIPHLASLGEPEATTAAAAGGGETASDSRRRRDWQAGSVARAILRGEFRAPPAGDSSRPSSNTVPDLLGGALSAAGPDAATVTLTGLADDPVHTDFDVRHDKPADGAPPPGRRSASYWRSVARIGRQVASALHYAHGQGTLHRDIKPANLLIDEQGTVWVADFGLAKAMEHDDVSRTGDIVGTLRYMAPEQLLGTADARSDIFSLGLTLYELLTFQPAYDEADRKRSLLKHARTVEPPPPRRSNRAVPADLETIVLKAIAPEPARRYQSAAEMAQDLERFLDDRPILARRATPVEHLWRWCRRNPAVAGLSTIALSLLVTVAIVSTIGYARTTAANQTAHEALAREKQQRLKAQATSRLAWNALDQIFGRFAPQRTVVAESFDVESDESSELPVATPPVLSDEAAALLEQLLNSYHLLAAQGDDDAAFQQRIADANRRVGDIRQRLGQYEQAENAYLNAIERYNEIKLQTPAIRARIAAISIELGRAYRTTRRYDEALAAYDLAERILRPVVEETASPAARYELARTYYFQADRWLRIMSGSRSSDGRRGSFRSPLGRDGQRSSSGSRGRRSGERRETEKLDQAIALLKGLLDEDPQVPEYQLLLAMSYLEHAKDRREDPARAEQSRAAALTILDALVERFPGNPDYRFALSSAYSLGWADDPGLTDEDVPGYVERHRQARDILQQLNQEHPNVPEYRASLAQVQHGLGTVLARFGRYEDAAPYFVDALQLQAQLTENHPQVYATRLAFMRQRYAEFLLARHLVDPDTTILPEARTMLAQATAAMELLVTDDRRWDPLRQRIAGNYRNLAEICTQLGDAQGAEAAETKSQQYAPRGGERFSRQPEERDNDDPPRRRGNPRSPPDAP